MSRSQQKPLAEVKLGDYSNGFKSVYQGNDLEKAREIADTIKKGRKQFVQLVFEGHIASTRY